MDGSAATFSLAESRRALFERMDDFRRAVRGRLLLEGCARVAMAATLLAILSFVFDHTFRLSLAGRLVMLIVFAGAIIFLCVRDLLLPLRLRLDPLTLAAALDRVANESSSPFAANVASILELSGQEKIAAPSAAMVREAVRRSNAAISTFDFRTRLDDHRRNLSVALLVCAIMAPIILASAAPATAKLWVARMFAGASTPWPQKTYLRIDGVTDGMLVVPRGEPFVLRASAIPGSIAPQLVSLRCRDADGGRISGEFASFGPNDFRYDFSGVNTPTTVEVWGGDDVMTPFVIRPADRPRISDLTLTSQHPWQPTPVTYTFSGSDTDLTFLPETRLRLLFSANTPIASAKLTSPSTQPSQQDLKQLDDEHFSLAWTHRAAAQLHIELTGRDAGLQSTPTDITIGLKVDQPPRVTLAYTGVHARVTALARIPLTIDARDDYGIARVSLRTQLQRPDPADPGKLQSEMSSADLFGPVSPAVDLEVQPPRTIELAPFKLEPGCLCTISVTATDACYTGPQTTVSRPITFRIVAPEELFREILLRQQAERARFRKQTDEVHAMRDAMNTLAAPADAAALAKRHRAVQREVAGIANSLAESVIEMRLNALATDEAYTLIEKNVLAPLKNLQQDLMTPQKDAWDALNVNDSKALAALEDRQDKMAAAMDEILRQMSQWDSFVDVLNQLNEVIRLQSQAQQQTHDLQKKQTEGIFAQ